MNKYPPPEEIPSAERQRIYYEQAVKEIQTLRNERTAANAVAHEYRHDAEELKADLKQSRRAVKMLTAKEHQASVTKSAAAFASASGVIMTVIWEAFKAFGYPFTAGNPYSGSSQSDRAIIDFFQHEAVFASCTAILTWLLAEVYKQSKS